MKCSICGERILKSEGHLVQVNGEITHMFHADCCAECRAKQGKKGGYTAADVEQEYNLPKGYLTGQVTIHDPAGETA